MNQISHTKEFFMLAVNEKGKIPALKQIEIYGCLLASSLMELINGGFVNKDEKGFFTIANPLTEDLSYLQPLYDRIATTKKPKNIEKLATDYLSGGKHTEALLTALRESLVEKDYKEVVENQGLFRNKTIYVPKFKELTKIISKIRKQFFGDIPLEEETFRLVSLLEASNLTREYFGRIDTRLLKEKLEELPDSRTRQLAKELIDSTIVMMTVLTAVVT